MDHALIGVLVFVLIVVVLVWAAIYVIDRTLPPDIRMPAKMIVGVIGLVVILSRLLPLAGL